MTGHGSRTNEEVGKRHCARLKLFRENIRFAQQILGRCLLPRLKADLRFHSDQLGLSLARGDLQILQGNCYVTHTGLLRLAHRRKCCGMQVEVVSSLCDAALRRYVLKATVYPAAESPGFVGYGDADPSNISMLVQGAELRVAETRAINRALRKAYGIGMCSVEEIGGSSHAADETGRGGRTLTGGHNGHRSGRKVRDRLCQIIRQHKLDPVLVKAYAVDFCGTKTLKDAAREQVEDFVLHLADRADKDRDGLLCQLNSYTCPSEEVVA